MAEVALDAKHRRVVQDFSAVIDVGSSQHEQTTDLVTRENTDSWRWNNDIKVPSVHLFYQQTVLL